jgi:2-polyprenyl-3-methyl-5-hydroxy-6-metoxy-1,4-benzoquinol methylase
LSRSSIDEALRGGHYAAKQIFCKDRLIAWSHRRRFEVGLRLMQQFENKRILDYGCGDGTFLGLVFSASRRPAEGVGAEIDDVQVNDCRARFAHLPDVRFVPISQLDATDHRSAYDVVVCMEVLEHVVALDGVIDRLWRLVRDDGTLLMSVPVETGIPLLLKQTARRIAGWRGVGDYRSTTSYTLREYVAALFAGAEQHMKRPVYDRDGAMPFHDHKGFNWRALRRRLETRFTVERVAASPLPWLGPRLATQVWFVARKKSV